MATYRIQRIFTNKVTEEDKKKLRRAYRLEMASSIPAIGGGIVGLAGMEEKKLPKSSKVGLGVMAAGMAGVAAGNIAQRKIYNKYHKKSKISWYDKGSAKQAALYGPYYTDQKELKDTEDMYKWVNKVTKN